MSSTRQTNTEKLLSNKLKKVGRQISHWRETRKKLGPMPAPLWSTSVDLARQMGVTRVSQELGLGYAALKQRVERFQPRSLHQGQSAVSQSAQDFLDFGTVLTIPPTGPQATVFEWSQANGARLTIRVDSSNQQKVTELAQTLMQQIR